MKKRVLSMLLVVALILGGVPSAALAAEDNEGGTYADTVMETPVDQEALAEDKSLPEDTLAAEENITKSAEDEEQRLEPEKETEPVLFHEGLEESGASNTMSLSFEDNGDGSKQNPYKIATPADLKALAEALSGENTYETAGVYFQQTAEIDMDGEEWVGIGTIKQPFQGNYDGQNNAIKNLEGTTGLFHVLSGDVVLWNICLEDAKINQTAVAANLPDTVYLGALADQYMTTDAGSLTMNNCVLKEGSVIHEGTSANGTGGLIGAVNMASKAGNRLTMEGCYAAGQVMGSGNVGGLIGFVANSVLVTEITKCGVMEQMTVTAGKQAAGGLIGYINTKKDASTVVKSCFADAKVFVSEPNTGLYAGGLIGWMATAGILKDSYAMGTVSGKTYVGGAVGYLSGDAAAEHLFAANEISCKEAGNTFGGLVGNMAGNAALKNSVALGASVDGGKSGTIMNRIAGKIAKPENLQDNFAFAQMMVNGGPPVAAVGAGTPNGADASTANLESKSFWIGLGFDLENVWQWSGAENKGYPGLEASVTQQVNIPADSLCIVTEPENAIIYPHDDKATFEVIARGDWATMTYQWQSAEQGTEDWKDVEGAISKILTIQVPQQTPLQYRCKIYEGRSSSEVITKAVTSAMLENSKVAALGELTFHADGSGAALPSYVLAPAINPGTRNYTVTYPYKSMNTFYFLPTLAEGFDKEQYTWEYLTFTAAGKESKKTSFAFDGKKGSVSSTDNAVKLRISVIEKASGRVVSQYDIDLLKARQLSKLTVGNGAYLKTAFDPSVTNQEVFLASTDSFQITPTTNPKNTVITVNGKTYASDDTITVPISSLENGSTLSMALSSPSGEEAGYVQAYIYTLNMIAPPVEKKPTFLMQEVQDAMYALNAEKVSALSVFASASGQVSYQWYRNTTKSTEGATAIPGATGSNYIPPVTQTGTSYYYCVASNQAEVGQSSTSEMACIKVYPVLTATLEVLTPGEVLPPVPGVVFEKEQGYWYPFTNPVIKPLEVKVHTSVDGTEFASELNVGNLSWSKKQAGSQQGGFARGLTCTPAAGKGAAYYWVTTTVTLGGQKVTLTSDQIYVHIADSTNITDWAGEGTKDSPWKIKTKEDLDAIGKNASQVNNYKDMYFELENDITVEKWTSGFSFSGTFDGKGHTLTFPRGSKALINSAAYATVKDLNIAGEYIADYGLVSNYSVASGVSRIIDIVNVTIKGGTTIKYSGFIGGFASGSNAINIIGCTAEKNVKIGYDLDANGPSAIDSGVGSFGGQFNGTLRDSVSYATVYGKDAVGGLIGQKGQSMGSCSITNSVFAGEIIATGSYVGGLVGKGYLAGNAPNTPAVSIQNCYVTGTISGEDCVGGLFGGEEGLVQCWDNGIGYIQNNYFSGKVKATKEGGYVGGIVGYLASLNCYNKISNNYYIEGCGADKGIGGVKYVDTNSANHETISGAIYFNTENGKASGITGATKTDHNRTDDPLGADAHKLSKSVTATQLKDGTVTDLLNSGENSYRNWINGKESPDLSNQAIVCELTYTGEFKDTYYVGEELDLSGMTFTAKWSDGTVTNPKPQDMIISGFDNSKRAVIKVTVSYGAAKTDFAVTILNPVVPDKKDIRVSFTLLGDEIHDSQADKKVHTNAARNLETWIEKKTYTVDSNATVEDVFRMALGEAGLRFEGEVNKQYKSLYIQGIQILGTKKMLSEFSNGPASGWMYTLNGKHPTVGLSQQFLENGDNIVWHHTDDYTKEEGSGKWGAGSGTSVNETERSVELKATVSNGKASISLGLSDVKEAIGNAKGSGQAIIIAPIVSSPVDVMEVTLKNDVISTIVKQTTCPLMIKTAVGNMTIPSGALASVASQAGAGPVTVIIEKVEKKTLAEEQAKKVGDSSIFEISITSSGKNITEFDSKLLTISLPYSLKASQTAEGVTVWYLQDKGELEKMNCKYDKGTGLATFTTTHLSKYLVGYTERWKNPFADVKENDWFYSATEYAVKAGLFNGTTETTFSPNNQMTRAMLVTVLYRLEGSPEPAGENVFADVKNNQWYTPGIIWANQNGLVTGMGSDLFGTNDNVTREQMATILYNYAKYKGYEVSKTAELKAFTDAAAVSSWATDCVKWANATGLLNGRTATELVPKGYASRGEVAAILMRFTGNITN